MQENVALQPEEPPAAIEVMLAFDDEALASDDVAAAEEVSEAEDALAFDETLIGEDGRPFAADEDDDDFFGFVVDAAEDAAALAIAVGEEQGDDDPRLVEMADALQILRDSEISHALRELRHLFPHIPFPFRVRALIAVRHAS